MLNENEKELIAVVRYYNEQRNKGRVGRLVRKIAKNIDVEGAASMTGFSVREVEAFCGGGENLLKPLTGFEMETVTKYMGKKPSTPTKKAAAGIVKAESNAINNPGPSKATKKVMAKVESQRLAIHLNAESDLPQRLAYDMAAHIEKEMKPGDAWLSRKEVMEKFECGSASLTIANGILLKHNWIELVEPGNFRKGYRVK